MAGLQSAFHINHLLEIYKESVKKLDNPAATPEGAVGGTKVDTPSKNIAQCCHEHAKEELKLYCETCGELVCYHCVIQGGKHHDHDHVLLKVAFEKYKEEISSSLEPMEKQVMIIEKALEELNTRCGEISVLRAAIEDNVHVTFRRLREVLTVRETEVIDQLHQMTQAKLKGLAAQRDQIEMTLARLNSCLHFMRESLNTGDESNVLITKANTAQQVTDLTTPFQQDALKPNTEADMMFSALADMTAMCQDYGQVISLDPSNFQVTGKGVEAAKVKETSTVILQAVNLGGKSYKVPIMSLECELESKITGTRTSYSVKSRGQSQYEISYQPTIKGRHQLHVKAYGQHVRGSPFSVGVKSQVENLSIPILTIGGMKRPWGVVINQRGEMVVCDRELNCVSVFSPSGVQLRSFGTCGSGHGEFNEPCGVAVDGEGNILVADKGNHRVQKFTSEGRFLAVVGTKGSGPLQFNFPIDIAISNNKVYVADFDNHRIQVLHSDLTFSSTFGAKGSDEGQFKHQQSISCDRTGNMYVADTNNHRIQVFTAEGEFLMMFGRYGQREGELHTPISIAVQDGLLYVGEGGNERVSVFTLEGRFGKSFGSKGEAPGQFRWPSGLTVDSNEVVYVCDSMRKDVQVF